MQQRPKEIIQIPSHTPSPQVTSSSTSSSSSQSSQSSSSSSSSSSSTIYYRVLKVIASRNTPTRRQYKILWQGYQDPTWQPLCCLLNAMPHVIRFEMWKRRETPKVKGRGQVVEMKELEEDGMMKRRIKRVYEEEENLEGKKGRDGGRELPRQEEQQEPKAKQQPSQSSS